MSTMQTTLTQEIALPAFVNQFFLESGELDTNTLYNLDPNHIPLGENASGEDRAAPAKVADLAKNVKAFGVRVPIVLEVDRETAKIHTGNRRVAAARIAGVRVPAMVIPMGSKQDSVIGNIIENEQRQNMNDIEKGQAILLLRSQNVPMKEAAALFLDSNGKPCTASWATNVATIAEKGSPEVQASLLKGEISLQAAYNLSRVKAEKQAEKLVEARAVVDEAKAEGRAVTTREAVTSVINEETDVNRTSKRGRPKSAKESSAPTVKASALLKTFSGWTDYVAARPFAGPLVALIKGKATPEKTFKVLCSAFGIEAPPAPAKEAPAHAAKKAAKKAAKAAKPGRSASKKGSKD